MAKGDGEIEIYGNFAETKWQNIYFPEISPKYLDETKQNSLNLIVGFPRNGILPKRNRERCLFRRNFGEILLKWNDKIFISPKFRQNS
jgi:hypothetical protein